MLVIGLAGGLNSLNSGWKSRRGCRWGCGRGRRQAGRRRVGCCVVDMGAIPKTGARDIDCVEVISRRLVLTNGGFGVLGGGGGVGLGLDLWLISSVQRRLEEAANVCS